MSTFCQRVDGTFSQFLRLSNRMHCVLKRRSMKKLKFLLATVLAFVSTFAVACTHDNNTIRISEVTRSVFYAPLYIAYNMDYFKDEGINMTFDIANGSDAVMTALISDEADIGLLGPEAVVYIHNRNANKIPKVFAQLTACDGSFLMGRSAETDFNWANLKGKSIIGGRKAGLPAMSLEYALKQAGLKPGASLGENVDTVLDLTVDFANTTSAFLAGTGDYVTAFEPSASMMVRNNNCHIITSVSTGSGTIPFTAFASMENYLKKNPEKIEKFIRALKKGQDYMLSATDAQLIAALKPSFKSTDDDILVSAVRNYISIGAYADSFVLSETSWTKLQDVIESAGELKARVPYANAIDCSYVKAMGY